MIFLTQYRTAASNHVELIEDLKYPQNVHWFPDTYKNVKTGLINPVHRVTEKVLTKDITEYIKNKPGKTGFILAAGNSHFAGNVQRQPYCNDLGYTYKLLPLTLTQVYAGRIAQKLNIKDLIITDSSACASSLKVLFDVHNLINNYGFETIVVLSVEDGVSNLVLDFFGETKASLSIEEEKQGVKPSAFDEINYGFNIGQGAVLAVFESSRSVKQTPKHELVFSFNSSEQSSNAIGQNENGEGFIKAIRGCLEYGKINNKDITVVKTHGTGTHSNNKAEKNALIKCLKDFVATSYKQKIGHTMGASGLLETCLLFDDIEKNIIPKIENRTKTDLTFLSKNICYPGGLILSLAAGMGNIYSAAVFKVHK